MYFIFFSIIITSQDVISRNWMCKTEPVCMHDCVRMMLKTHVTVQYMFVYSRVHVVRRVIASDETSVYD